MCRKLSFNSLEFKINGLPILDNLELKIIDTFDPELYDIVVVPLRSYDPKQKKLSLELLDESDMKVCYSVLEDAQYKASYGSICTVYTTSKDSLQKIIFLGLGVRQLHPMHIINSSVKDSIDDSYKTDSIGRILGKLLLDCNQKTLCLCCEDSTFTPTELQLLIQELILGLSPDNRFQTKISKFHQALTQISVFYSPNNHQSNKSRYIQAIEKSLLNVKGIQLARELVNTPANYCTTEALATVAVELAKTFNWDFKILDEIQCRNLNMGAYLAVNKGSSYKPQFIHLTYRSNSSTESLIKIALIGKGVCMDTGGYNLKVAGGIETMKIDMGGAAAVLGAAYIIGLSEPLGVEVHFIIPAAENMVDSLASRPGDIVFASNGMSIEIGNTDAEGRLTLADAIVYSEKNIQVDYIIECSTLTNAIRIGLGPNIAALYSNSACLTSTILTSSVETGTPIWPMPLYKPYRRMNESNIADISNVGNTKLGGSIQAALFLHEFVKQTQFCHIDLAGPVIDESSKLATGYGPGLLASAILNLSKL